MILGAIRPHLADRGRVGRSAAIHAFSARSLAVTLPGVDITPSSERRPLAELVAADWAEALAPQAERIAAMGDFLRAELAAGRPYLPAGQNVLRAFARPMADVRVLIVGQDPYPTPGHAVGLSFSVAPDVRPVPRSLANIYRELHDDLGCPSPTSGDLTPWAEQGVLLLNRVLTVAPRLAGVAPRQGLGGGHRRRDPGPGRAGRAARGDPVGPRRPGPGADARRHPQDRLRAPEPDVGGPWVLRLAALQPVQRRTRGAGRDARSTGACPDPAALTRCVASGRLWRRNRPPTRGSP